MFTSSKIKSVKSLGFRIIYDISVEDDYSYVGNNIVNHNSKEPNLQNIPRGTTAADIKRMFLPPPRYVTARSRLFTG